MKSASLVVLLTISVPGCGTQAGPATAPPVAIDVPAMSLPPSSPPLSSPRLRGEVLVRHGAWLYASPNTTPRFRHNASDRPHQLHHVTRFRVVRDEGEWIVVAPPSSSSAHSRDCAYVEHQLGGYGLTVAVRRRDLAPVLVRTVERAFDDGTSFTLWSGIPVGEASEGGSRRPVGNALGELYFPIPGDAVGLSFPHTAPSRDAPPHVLKLQEHATLSYGDGQTLTLDASPPAFHTIEEREDAMLVTFEARCLRLVARADENAFAPKVPSPPVASVISAVGNGAMLGVLSKIVLQGNWHTVSKGTPVTWQDGRPAGTTSESRASSKKMTRRGERSCFAVVLGRHGPITERRFELCVPTASVIPQSGPFENALEK